MKLGLASDLHLSFGPMNPEFFDWRGDVLFIAGDLDEEDWLRKHGTDFFNKVSKMADHVVIILGNHEHYRSELDVSYWHLKEWLSKQWGNIHLLENSVWVLDHIEVFAATMWTDYHGSPLAELHAQQMLNDFKYIRVAGKGFKKILPRDILREHMLAKNELLNFLEEDTGRIKLVMTHHAPSMRSVPNRFRHDRELNMAYCNAFDRLIEENPKIHCWMHGRTHDYFDYIIGQTRILCNSRGYPGERPAHLPPYQPVTFFL